MSKEAETGARHLLCGSAWDRGHGTGTASVTRESLHRFAAGRAARQLRLPAPIPRSANPQRPVASHQQCLHPRAVGTMQASSSVSRLSGASKLQAARAASSQRASGSRRLVVTAKVDLQGAPRVIRGKCFVTKDVSAARGLSCCMGSWWWSEGGENSGGL